MAPNVFAGEQNCAVGAVDSAAQIKAAAAMIAPTLDEAGFPKRTPAPIAAAIEHLCFRSKPDGLIHSS